MQNVQPAYFLHIKPNNTFITIYKNRQPKWLPIMSERGDSNARPLRPERSALPTALLSVLRLQRYIIFSEIEILS